MIDIIDGEQFRNMIRYGAAAIQAKKQSINDLNVFPVPDGDTGTNMSLTIGAAVTALAEKQADTVGRPLSPPPPCCVAPGATPASFCPCCSAASPGR